MNPFENRDLHSLLLFPTLSWSSINSFRYDKESWYKRYVLGIRDKHKNAAILAGNVIGEKWALDENYLPEVERPEVFEKELRGEIFSINLMGHLDGLSLKKKKKLFELKTSQSDKKWTSETVRTWGQITFYCLLIWLNYKIPPEEFEIELIYVPVKESGSFEVVRDDKSIKIIPTKRTMKDVLVFGAEIKKVFGEMQEYVNSYPHLTPNLR